MKIHLTIREDYYIYIYIYIYIYTCLNLIFVIIQKFLKQLIFNNLIKINNLIHSCNGKLIKLIYCSTNIEIFLRDHFTRFHFLVVLLFMVANASYIYETLYKAKF